MGLWLGEWMGGWMGGWIDGWRDGWTSFFLADQQSKRNVPAAEWRWVVRQHFRIFFLALSSVYNIQADGPLVNLSKGTLQRKH